MSPTTGNLHMATRKFSRSFRSPMLQLYHVLMSCVLECYFRTLDDNKSDRILTRKQSKLFHLYCVLIVTAPKTNISETLDKMSIVNHVSNLNTVFL